MKRHIYTKKEDEFILRCTSENIDNLRNGFRKAALKIGVSWQAVCLHYYHILRPQSNQSFSLKKVLRKNLFFMFSKKRLYIQGKNSPYARIQPINLSSEDFKRRLNELQNKSKRAL